jgi:branched-chain amino acid transport system substrate-binding protein
VGALVIAGCGGSSSSTTAKTTSVATTNATTSTSGTSSTAGTSSSPSASAGGTSSCGPKPGVKATGSPIEVGAIDTKQSGTDFTDIGNMESAYFDCVNANGGVNGHPVKIHVLTEPSQPAQAIADAHQLVQSDHVVAISGSSSFIECSVNYKYWEQEGYKVIADGVAPECYSTPNYSDTNAGLRFGLDETGAYLMGIPGVKKIVVDQANLPGTTYNMGGIEAIAKAHGVPVTTLTENAPITDASSVALKEVDAAGPDGAVLIDFTPPDALVIMKAAEKLGLENRVKMWACSTPCDTDFLAKALGPKWVGKFFVNAELNPPDDPEPNSPQMKLYKAVYNQYGKSTVTGGIGAFSEMGFTDAVVLQHALESVHGAYTKESVNKAIENVKDFDTGMLCVPWTYGPYPQHMPNYAYWMVTPNAKGQMVVKQGCKPISAQDPDMNSYYKVIGFTPKGA